MKTLSKQTRILSEGLVANELIKKGFQILKRNFASRFGEIDIIAKDGDTLVFVDVKAKKKIELGRLEEMINASKLKRIQNMETIYMKGKAFLCRIDIVTVIFTPENKAASLTHYKNVYS